MDRLKSKVFFLLEDGTELPYDEYMALRKPEWAGIGKIGKYFSYFEYRFKQDIEQFGKLVVPELLMTLMDLFREEVGPTRINSFNRTEEYQKHLHSKGFKAATHSPHVVKLACDIDTLSEKETHYKVDVLRKLAKRHGFKIRVGYWQYLQVGQTFIHVDICPMYYGPGEVWNGREHPWQWEKETRW